jgi:hypothetical protein
MPTFPKRRWLLVFYLPALLKIYPLTLGSGKRLFVDGTIPAAFKVRESTGSPNSIVMVNYDRAGANRTGSY